MILDAKATAKLVGVHPDLVKIVQRAAKDTKVPFLVVEGLRSKTRQKYLFDTGKSKTMKSRHLDGHAVDLAPVIGGVISWDWKDFWPLVETVETAAKAVGVPIEPGARWTSFPDGPHFQLPWAKYP